MDFPNDFNTYFFENSAALIFVDILTDLKLNTNLYLTGKRDFIW